jgi:hypothetical protein
MDGFIEGNGFSILKCDYRTPLVDMANMRKADGSKRFTFVPPVKELMAMSEEDLYNLVLKSAKVMLDKTAYMYPQK